MGTKHNTWVGVINGVKVSLELNNSGYLPRKGATGLEESTEAWAVQARAAGALEAILNAEKASDAKGWKIPSLKSETGSSLRLQASWQSGHESTASTAETKAVATLLDVMDVLHKSKTSKDVLELLDAMMAPVTEALEQEKARRKAATEKLRVSVALDYASFKDFMGDKVYEALGTKYERTADEIKELLANKAE